MFIYCIIFNIINAIVYNYINIFILSLSMYIYNMYTCRIIWYVARFPQHVCLVQSLNRCQLLLRPPPSLAASQMGCTGRSTILCACRTQHLHDPIYISLSTRIQESVAVIMSPFFLLDVFNKSTSKVGTAVQDVQICDEQQVFFSHAEVTSVARTMRLLVSRHCLFHWIGLRENLQETIVFTIKYRAFL